MKRLLIFVIGFMIIYLFYFLFVILKNKKFNDRKIPVEVMYLVGKYKLDINKINYKKLLNWIGLSLAFSISVALTCVSFLESMVLELLLAFVIMLFLLLICFAVIGNIYKRKGMTRNV